MEKELTFLIADYPGSGLIRMRRLAIEELKAVEAMSQAGKAFRDQFALFASDAGKKKAVIVFGDAATSRAVGIKKLLEQQTPSSSISTTQKDLTTVPTTNFPKISASPILNPTTIPDSPTTNLVPFNTPSTSSPSIQGASWCIASQTTAKNALQIALNFACGLGKVDCSAIHPGGSCYIPSTFIDHASYAFNNYQKKSVPNSCNFGGTAIITSTDPSTKTCHYPSISTSSSVLDTSSPSTSIATPKNKALHLWNT